MSIFKKSAPYYDPEKRYRITIYIGNMQSFSGNVGNLSSFLRRFIQKKPEWILMPTNDDTPDLFIRR